MYLYYERKLEHPEKPTKAGREQTNSTQKCLSQLAALNPGPSSWEVTRLITAHTLSNILLIHLSIKRVLVGSIKKLCLQESCFVNDIPQPKDITFDVT